MQVVCCCFTEVSWGNLTWTEKQEKGKFLHNEERVAKGFMSMVKDHSLFMTGKGEDLYGPLFLWMKLGRGGVT